jgi:putative ABC transport system ATP-binding protein
LGHGGDIASATRQKGIFEMTALAYPVDAAFPADDAHEGAVVLAGGLVRRYGDGATAVEALRGVSLGIEAGRMTAIMGPSGSGKSTLMHLLAGLDQPTEGRIVVDGVDITKLSEKKLTQLRRNTIGFVFQFFNLLPMLTAEENVTLPLQIASKKIDKEWLDELLKTVGIGDRRHHRPSELSGGQQQRVAIARALISKPKVVFADEPTGNLDSQSSKEVLAMLRRAVDEWGQTIVMVTHDAGAAAMADRILFIADGRIVRDLEESTAAEVLAAMQEVSSR